VIIGAIAASIIETLAESDEVSFITNRKKRKIIMGAKTSLYVKPIAINRLLISLKEN
jgi:hypothetical protein